MAIRFGICKDFDMMDFVAKAGFDYIEPAFRTLVNLSDEEFENIKAKSKELNLKCEAFNLFAPHSTPSLRFEDIAPNIDEFKGLVYKGMARAKELGAEILVIGCGWLRKVPEEMDREHALEETAKTFRVVADIAAEYGITIVAEPLNTTETNFINTIKDGSDFIEYCKHPSIQGLVDFYHTYRNHESLEEIRENMGKVVHTHFARPNDDRCYPLEEDIPMLKEWSKILKDAGYDARLSSECRTREGANEQEEIIRTLKMIRECFA